MPLGFQGRKPLKTHDFTSRHFIPYRSGPPAAVLEAVAHGEQRSVRRLELLAAAPLGRELFLSSGSKA